MEAIYRERMNECLAEAAEAKLPQVRERCQRSAEAWLVMAERAARHSEISAAKR